MPFFSIIIPVYNVAPYLRECLDSVLAQTFTDWEAICVDDGAKDGSGAILDEYVLLDTRFRVIHQANAGVSVARNVALNVARGEWLCFLDADDKVEEHWLQDINDGAKRHPEVDWIRTSYRDWFEGMEPVPWSEESVHRYSEIEYEDIVCAAWNMLAHAGMPCLNVFKRTKNFKIRFPVGQKYSEDLCFTLDYLIDHTETHRLLTIPNDSYRYRIRDSSASHSARVGEIVMSLSAVMTKWKILRGKWGAFTPSIERHIYRCLRPNPFMQLNEAKKLRRFLWKATWCGFFSPFHVNGKRQCIRWILFMLFGKPQFLTDKAGIRWFFPARHPRND